MKLGKYHVWWSHYTPDITKDKKLSAKYSRPISSFTGTLCNVDADPYGEPGKKIVSGFAELSKSDNYNKEIGRKVSLTRAIGKLKLSKEERRDIWVDYFNRS